MLTSLLALDGGILLWIQEFARVAFLNPIFVVYTHLGDFGLLWIVLSAGMLCFRKTRKAGALALAALLLGTLVTNGILKPLVGRGRPWLTVEGLHYLTFEADPASFPSGHTCAAFAAAGVWFAALPKRQMGVAGLCMAALMGFSRLYVGVHFPSDVLAGALVGLACAAAVWYGYRAWQSRKRTI